MKKEDIINRYKEEGVDEGKEYTNQFSDTQGFYALCGLSFILTIYKIWAEQPFGDTASILFIFLSVGAFYRYQKEKDKAFLYFSILNGLLCLVFLLWYILATVGM